MPRRAQPRDISSRIFQPLAALNEYNSLLSALSCLHAPRNAFRRPDLHPRFYNEAREQAAWSGVQLGKLLCGGNLDQLEITGPPPGCSRECTITVEALWEDYTALCRKYAPLLNNEKRARLPDDFDVFIRNQNATDFGRQFGLFREAWTGYFYDVEGVRSAWKILGDAALAWARDAIRDDDAQPTRLSAFLAPSVVAADALPFWRFCTFAETPKQAGPLAVDYDPSDGLDQLCWWPALSVVSCKDCGRERYTFLKPSLAEEIFAICSGPRPKLHQADRRPVAFRPETDGPAEGDLFRWNGETVELTHTQWRLVDYLWAMPDRQARKEDVLATLWHGNAQNALKQAATKANSRFAAHEVQLTIRVRKLWVVLEIGF